MVRTGKAKIKMAYKIKTKKGYWNDGTKMTEKDIVYGELNDRQIKAYYDFKREGFKHKTALELAKTL